MLRNLGDECSVEFMSVSFEVSHTSLHADRSLTCYNGTDLARKTTVNGEQWTGIARQICEQLSLAAPRVVAKEIECLQSGQTANSCSC